MERINLNIEGMSCGHCVSAVRNALADVDGVSIEKVEIGHATVSYDPQFASVGAVVDAIADAGYSAQEAVT